VFCAEIKWIDAIVLTADDMDDIVAMTMFTVYNVHSQRMLGNLAQHCKLSHCQPIRLA